LDRRFLTGYALTGKALADGSPEYRDATIKGVVVI
jgi:hypothetical protein